MRRALGMPLTTVLDHLRVMDSRRHLRRRRHPRDGRARELALTNEGVEVHRRTSQIWAPIHKALEEAVTMPVVDVRRALRAVDRAAAGLLAQDNRMAASG
jgi:DNA-binding MarR family transcriptional regulator